jgi:hypothetical protein
MSSSPELRWSSELAEEFHRHENKRGSSWIRVVNFGKLRRLEELFLKDQVFFFFGSSGNIGKRGDHGEFLGAESLPHHGVHGLRRKQHTETAPGGICTLRRSVECHDLSFLGLRRFEWVDFGKLRRLEELVSWDD